MITEENNKAIGDLWVIAELDNGAPLGITKELLAAASALAAKAQQKCGVVVICDKAGSVPEELIAVGADKVYLVEGEQYADYNTDNFTDAICQLVKEYKPLALVMGSTADGRDLAPRIAARLKTGLSADCTELDITEDNLVAWTRPALGGNIYATIVCDKHWPQMGTVRPKVFKALEPDASRTGEIIKFVPAPTEPSKVEILEKAALVVGNAIKIEDAKVIVAGGRGMGTQENFAKLNELAALFENSAIAGSRAIVDEGWLPHSQQVGQSGKNVSPHIYFACGISGAVQHVSGMKESDIIIAINKDPNAEIFQIAHYGIVGDVNAVLPQLIEKIKAQREA